MHYIQIVGSEQYPVPGKNYPEETNSETLIETGIIIAKFNVTDTTNPTLLFYIKSESSSDEEIPFTSMKIDDVEQQEVVNLYIFSTTGEHTVEYTLTDMTSISNDAFRNCISLTSIIMPNSVTSIGDNAFYNCYGLTEITIGNGVTSIGDSAFMSCRGFTSITIPNNVTSIGLYAFYQCINLTSCTIGSGVTSIGDYAFYDCRNLTSITSNATTAPTIESFTFQKVKTNGTLYVPLGSTGYDTWMQNANYYLGEYNWTKVEQ